MKIPLAITTEREQKIRPRSTDASRYNPAALASWPALWKVSGSVLSEWELWRMVLLCGVVSMLSGTAVGFVPGLHVLGNDSFKYLANIIRVLLAFILALYLSASLKRWWVAMLAMSKFFDAVKSLMLVMTAVGAPAERKGTTRRYAVLSAYVLRHEVRTMFHEDEFEQDKWVTTVGQSMLRGWMNHDEMVILNNSPEKRNRASMIWSWIGVLVGQTFSDLNQKGHQPVAAQLTKLALAAMCALSNVKTSVSYQIPLSYVHTVAILVHTNNILLSVLVGVATASQAQRAVDSDSALEGDASRGDKKDFARSIQRMIVYSFSLFVNPLIYQAFLHIGTCLNDPFSETGSAFPIHEFVDELEETLTEIEILGDQQPNTAIPSTTYRPPQRGETETGDNVEQDREGMNEDDDDG
jgi:hypothetical protein